LTIPLVRVRLVLKWLLLPALLSLYVGTQYLPPIVDLIRQSPGYQLTLADSPHIVRTGGSVPMVQPLDSYAPGQPLSQSFFVWIMEVEDAKNINPFVEGDIIVPSDFPLTSPHTASTDSGFGFLISTQFQIGAAVTGGFLLTLIMNFLFIPMLSLFIKRSRNAFRKTGFELGDDDESGSS
jgi:hypothetical protein